MSVVHEDGNILRAYCSHTVVRRVHPFLGDESHEGARPRVTGDGRDAIIKETDGNFDVNMRPTSRTGRTGEKIRSQNLPGTEAD